MTRREAIKLAIAGALSPLLSLLPEGEKWVRIEGPAAGNLPGPNKCDPQFHMINETRVSIEFQGYVVPPHSTLEVPRHKVEGFRGMTHVVWRESDSNPDYKWVKRGPLPVQKEARND